MGRDVHSQDHQQDETVAHNGAYDKAYKVLAALEVRGLLLYLLLAQHRYA